MSENSDDNFKLIYKGKGPKIKFKTKRLNSIISHEKPLEYFATFDQADIPIGWSGTPGELFELITSEPRINIRLGKDDKIVSYTSTN